jgi:ferredoxin--NADP+ reductase
MYKIIKNINLTKDIYLMQVEAENVCHHALPGEFVIVMAHETSERIPLTIVAYDSKTVTLVYQIVGFSTLELSRLSDNLFSIVGPLGNKSIYVDNFDYIKNKRILFVGGGVGIAPILPQVKYMYEHNIKSDIIYGAKSKSYIIFEDELNKYVSKLYITTDDGTYGSKGLVTDILSNIIDDYDLIITIGPVIMMKYVTEIAIKHDKEVIVSMNPIMVDGSGMCGACRLLVDGTVKFACIDGPEFDGSKVDFDAAIKRMSIYKTEEGRAYLREIEGSTHEGGCMDGR